MTYYNEVTGKICLSSDAGAVECATEPPEKITGFSLRNINGVWTSTRINSVTRAKARIALLRKGLLADVDAMVEGLGQEEKEWFLNATEWERTHPVVELFSTALGLSADEIDELFLEASYI